MFTIPIVKVDEERRLVYGRATDETPDAQGEVMDYESTKPHVMQWSQEQAAATGGRSLGNLRSMHGQCASGLIKDIQFDDHAKAVDIVARVVDDNEWQKVCEGVLTSFSLGGKYLKRWPSTTSDGQAVMRYTAQPSEISLVDRPANPNARVWEILKGTHNRIQHAVEETFMHIPKDENFCGRSTAANLIKAALAGPGEDLADAFFAKGSRAKRRENRANRRERRLMQGVGKVLETELAKVGMRVRGPTTSGYNGAEGNSIDAIRQIHEGGARKMSPVSLPPQSENSATAPTRIHPHIVAPQGDQYRFNPPTPTPFGAPPQSASEHQQRPLPTDSDDRQGLDKVLAEISAIHRQGPKPMWER
jgi:hypothetical protein